MAGFYIMDPIEIVKTIETDGTPESLATAALSMESEGFKRMTGLLPINLIKLPIYRIHGDSEGEWFGDCKVTA